ncbi:MAG: hypothetical protein HFH58_17450 [Lachnospiraceae bacterium]|jgi:hypothetical protein|nr:hypothetical protein [Lachnospiraceae bacterium]
MRRLSTFAVLNIDGGDRISFTYDEINEETEEPVSTNNKKSFYVINPELADHINAIRQYIRQNKLEG